MRYRFVIEHSGDDWQPYCLSEDDPEGNRVSGFLSTHTVDDAKALAQQGFPGTELKWKDPPVAWGPDVICVSQFVDDGIEDNRDD